MISKNLKAYSYLTFFSFGFFVMILSSAFPKVLADFSIDYLHGGYLLSLGTLGYISGSLVCALFAHKLGLKLIAILGPLFLTLGSVGYAFSKDFLDIVVAAFVANVGTGMVEVGVGSLVGNMAKERASSSLNRVNSLFALGAFLSPFVVSLFMRTTFGWRGVYIIEALVAAIAFIFSFHLKTPNSIFKENLHLKTIFEPSILLIDLLIMVYVGCEVGYSAWISTFLVHVRNMDVALAAASSSVFWIGMFFGRYLASFVKIKDEKWVFMISISSLISVLAFMFSFNLYLTVIFIFLSGLSFASTYPTIQGMLAKRAGERIGNIMGVFVVFVGIGATVSQWLIGKVANSAGIFVGFGVVPALIVLEILLSLFFYKTKSQTISVKQG